MRRRLRAYAVRPRCSRAPPLKERRFTDPAEAEQQAIHRALQASKGNKSEAARYLQTDYKTLYLKIKQYGIEARGYRAS